MKTPTVTIKLHRADHAAILKSLENAGDFRLIDAIQFGTVKPRKRIKPDRMIDFIRAHAPSDFLVQTTSETLTAYADSVENPTPDAMRRRNLAFKSAHTVTVAEARAIFAKACPHGYNAFEAKVLHAIPADRLLYLAREGSPCVYVLGPEMEAGTQDKALADEFDFYPDSYAKTCGDNRFTIPGPVTRVWWD